MGEVVRRHGWLTPLEPCGPDCDDVVCRCDGEPECEHDHYSFLDDGTKYCQKCFDELDEPEEEA